MEPEGMVHALETIHGLLNPNGVLIDLRPKGIPAQFWGHQGEESTRVGHIDETDDFVEYRQAAQAMEAAISNKWFHLLKSGEYEFNIHAESLDQLHAYLETEWTDAVIPAEIQSKILAMKPEKITLRDFIQIGILQAI